MTRQFMNCVLTSLLDLRLDPVDPVGPFSGKTSGEFSSLQLKHVCVHLKPVFSLIRRHSLVQTGHMTVKGAENRGPTEVTGVQRDL